MTYINLSSINNEVSVVIANMIKETQSTKYAYVNME